MTDTEYKDILASKLLLWSIEREMDAIGAPIATDYVLDKAGLARTIQTPDALCLHFGDFSVQSLMSLKEPDRLCLSYTQAMMGFKLFRPCPENILIVGLGGGSLSKYCYRRFPNARITTVEISNDVIGFRKKFRVPDDDHRFRIIHADAAEYIGAIDERPDILLLDGYSAMGLPEALSSLTFYEQCHLRLSEDGILVANYHLTDPQFRAMLQSLSTAFRGNCLVGNAEGCLNYVALACKSKKRLRDDIQTDIRRLMVKSAKGLQIPYFEAFQTFFERQALPG